MLSMGSYLKNTVNDQLEEGVEGGESTECCPWEVIWRIQGTRNLKKEWKVESQRNAVNGKLSGEYSE